MSEAKINEALKIVINESACTKCGTCALACPVGIFHQASKDAFPEINNSRGCISCGQCAAVCTEGAISHSSFPDGSTHTVDPFMLPSAEQALNMLRMRRSIRAFQEKAVEKELVDLVIEGAKSAPTGSNVQNVEYVVVQDPATLDEIKKSTAEFYAKMVMVLNNQALIDNMPVPRRDAMMQMKPMLPMFERIDKAFKAGADPVLRGASNLLVFHSVKTPFDRVNTTLAVENAMLMCSSLGLGSFYIGFIQAIVDREPSIQKIMGIPDGHGINGIIAFGYPKYTFNKWIDRRPAKVTWITPDNNDVLTKFKGEEYRKNVEYWDNFSKNYDEGIDHDYGRRMRSLGAGRLKKEGHFAKVAEFGCGTGYFSKVLLEMSDSVLVTDLSEKFLEIARERLKGMSNVSFKIADCEMNGMPDNEFYTVFTGLLGNSIDTGKAYAEIYRILKPGGAFITYTVLPEILDAESKYQLFMRRASQGKTPPPKYYERTLENFRMSAEKAGFRIATEEVVRDSEDATSVPFLYMKCIK
jgi:nitroreductase/ubiquinone/menaquinone biosynthesis C-methylase UbiE/Pyruvate/2-oxoacid:ferredoxin oxidoreductase delta subunit